MKRPFDLQGHRGARGLHPENTLPSFEAALDHGITSVETDVFRTRDDVIILCHDHQLSPVICRRADRAPGAGPTPAAAVRALTLGELREWVADGNSDPQRFSSQAATVLPLSARFAAGRDMHPYAIPTLADLMAFVDAYAGREGAYAGKTAPWRANAGNVIL